MPFVQSDLVRAALYELNRLDAGDTVAAEDAAVVEPRIGPLLADLAGRRILPVLNPAAIPDVYFSDLARVLAEHVALPFAGRPVNVEALAIYEGRLRSTFRLAGTSTLADEVLERLEAIGAGSDAVDVAAVNRAIPRVLADLSRRLIVTIADETAVLPAQRPHVVVLVAARVQPKGFGPDAVAEAEGRLLEGDRLEAGTDQLVRHVFMMLSAWGTLAPGFTAAKVAATAASVTAEFGARGIELTDAALPQFAIYIAADLCGGAKEAERLAAERRLRSMAFNYRPSEPVRACYF